MSRLELLLLDINLIIQNFTKTTPPPHAKAEDSTATAPAPAAAFEGDVAGVVDGVESLRSMEGDAGWAQ